MATYYVLITAELATATLQDRSKEGWETCQADGLNHALLIAELARAKRFPKSKSGHNVYIYNGDKAYQAFP